MGAIIFVNTGSLAVRRLHVSGEDLEIADFTLVNMIKKWIIPWLAGSEFMESVDREGHVHDPCEAAVTGSFIDEQVDYGGGISEFQADIVGGKPLMLTVETIDGIPQIVLYLLDAEVLSEDAFGEPKTINPAIDPAGDNKIKKWAGGLVDDDDGGLSWELKVDDGSATLKEGEVLPFPLTVEDMAPFLLFRRNDIA